MRAALPLRAGRPEPSHRREHGLLLGGARNSPHAPRARDVRHGRAADVQDHLNPDSTSHPARCGIRSSTSCRSRYSLQPTPARRLEEPPRAAPESTRTIFACAYFTSRLRAGACGSTDPRASCGAFGTHATGVWCVRLGGTVPECARAAMRKPTHERVCELTGGSSSSCSDSSSFLL